MERQRKPAGTTDGEERKKQSETKTGREEMGEVRGRRRMKEAKRK